MATEDGARSGAGTKIRRLPCEWCDEPEQWPDLCGEAIRRHDQCPRLVERMCKLGDHRRCSDKACAAAARWHEPVRRMGMEAARAAGAEWAVVSTLADTEEIVGTEDDLYRAKSVLRNGALKAWGATLGPYGKGFVYVVRGSDGGFF